MKTVTAAVLMLVLVVAAVEGGSLRKRFLFKEIKHAFESVGHAVADFASDTYDSAKDAFHKVADNISFDKAVDALIPFIHSDTTVGACTATCEGVSSTVLGSDADEASLLCGPTCEGALAKLEEMAG